MRKITFLLLTILPLIALGQNLAPNPTLNGSTDWSDLNPGTTQAYDAGFTRTADGSGSWLINSDGTYNSGIKSANISGLSAGEYSISYYVYGNAGDKTKPIIRDNGIGSNLQGTLYTIQADNTWELVQETFTISGTGTVNLRAMVNSDVDTMDFWVDDFTFEYIPPSGNTLTVNVVGAGDVALNLDKISYDPTDVETLTANPATHWNFDSWSGDLTGSTNPETLLMDSDKTVTANFTIDPTFDYAFNFATDGELEGWTMDPNVTVVSHTGGLVTLNIVADQWSRFNLFDFPIPAAAEGENDPAKYNKVTVVVKNEEPTTDQFGITLGPNNETRIFPLLAQVAFQTFEIDLTEFLDWTGDVDSFRIRFADEDNPSGQGKPTVTHDVVIDSVVFSFDAALNTKDVLLDAFVMYPNPANNVLNIESPSRVETVEIFDITGKQVLTNNGFENTIKLNVSGLNSGLYLVKLTDVNNNSAIKKLILK